MDKTFHFTRRRFFKVSGLGLFAMQQNCRQTPLPPRFPIQVQDDLLAGHRLFETPPEAKPEPPISRDVLVVGAGIAGLAAAHGLRHRETVICELGSSIGGSSSAHHFQGAAFAQGAHYEVEYPPYFGREVLELLEKLQVIRFNKTRWLWEFCDGQFLIDSDRERRSWIYGTFGEDVLPPGRSLRRFVAMTQTYEGRLPLPTRLIAEDFRALDSIDFRQFLGNLNMLDDARFLEALDYQLRDDYGAGSDQVSALAGLHYYRCRPYYNQALRIFSPPQGNAYFAEKLAAGLDADRLFLNHLVYGIHQQKRGFRVNVLDLKANRTRTFVVNQIVFAGHKHGLRYILPDQAHLFGKNHYAPWLTINLILDRAPKTVYWQNEVLGLDRDLIGFINSNAQNGGGRPTVLTAYFCLPRQARKLLLEVAANPVPWVNRALEAIAESLGSRVETHVLKAFIKIHGHAMPIPVPNYLFRDANAHRKYPDLVYAGVDNGRLPLLFEALDSGLSAVRALEPS